MVLNEIEKLIHSPRLKDLMPNSFNYNIEAEHLFNLIDTCDDLKAYCFEEFICAGGSGMVFKVKRSPSDDFYTAIKVIRKAVYENKGESPFTSRELDALKELSHPNIVRLYDTIKLNNEVVAVCTSYIENAQGIDRYIQDTLNQIPSSSKDIFSQVSISRLENTCETIATWVYEIAQALAHMHRQGYYHLDIKPANILIQGKGNIVHPIITDMGSCVKSGDLESDRVHFTWAYAHPDLRDIKTGAPGSIEGGALRVSAKVNNAEKLPIYDLYALGKTIQQILAVIDLHFGEACYSNYSFRYLHILSALLLDGRNMVEGQKITENAYQQNGIRFVTSFPMNLSEELLMAKKITSADDLVQKLKRRNKDYSIVELAPEFSFRCPNTINNTIGDVVPFTNRVSKVFNHPTMKRLYQEPQLGLMTEIYPGASHNRWSHSLGVYAVVVKYYISLLSDPENPLIKIIINKEDIMHAFLAAIMHDLGQTSICHDVEAANSRIFNHLSYISKLLDEVPSQDETCLKSEIIKYWGKEIDFDRIIRIINHRAENPVDNIASDCIDGPIDADKLDYIKRDSYYCGVAYGDGIDYERIMGSLTVAEQNKQLRLAYYAKGRTAISSMLLARYQLYGAVYWHHTYRCLHSMLYYATQLAFGNGSNDCKIKINKSKEINSDSISVLYFKRVLCKNTWLESWKSIGQDYHYLSPLLKEAIQNSEKLFPNDYALGFIYAFTNNDGKKLLEQLRKRVVYKRIYAKSLKKIDLSELIKKCDNRVEISKRITESLLGAIRSNRIKSDRNETSYEIMITERFDELEDYLLHKCISIIVDFPQKISIPPRSWPSEVGDSARKLQNYGAAKADEIVIASNDLLAEVASIRIYAEPQLYSLISRYLSTPTIEDCIAKILNI